MFDQTKLIESTKLIIRNFINNNASGHKLIVGFPDIGDDNLIITEPNIYIEYNRSIPIDPKKGKSTGRGNRNKRLIVVYDIEILTNGTNQHIMLRDRIAQALEIGVINNVEWFHSIGIKNPDFRYQGSYRVREGINLARCELYFEVVIKS